MNTKSKKGESQMSYINKQRLVGLFCELAKIPSPSGKEEKIADIVIEKLTKLGLKTQKDKYGNIIARFNGKGKPLILCCHMDTVAIGEGKKITPKIKGNVISSDGTTILGADNKDSISAIIEMLTIIVEKNVHHRALEIVFTKEEETISKGASNLDFSLLKGNECIISDLADKEHGTIVISAPYCFRFDIKIMGKRSHVKTPEKGINAILITSRSICEMPLGKIDELTTVNIGYQISGLKGVIDQDHCVTKSLSMENRNTVPDLALVFGEIRGAKLDIIKKTLRKIEKIFILHGRQLGGRIEFDCRKLANGYLLKTNDPLVKKISEIFKSQKIKPSLFHSVGGSDANILNAHGIKTIVIASPHKNNHKYTEQLSIDGLLLLTDFYFRLVTKKLPSVILS